MGERGGLPIKEIPALVLDVAREMGWVDKREAESLRSALSAAREEARAAEEHVRVLQQDRTLREQDIAAEAADDEDRLRAACGTSTPSGGNDWIDEVCGLLRVARSQRDAAEQRAREAEAFAHQCEQGMFQARDIAAEHVANESRLREEARRLTEERDDNALAHEAEEARLLRLTAAAESSERRLRGALEDIASDMCATEAVRYDSQKCTDFCADPAGWCEVCRARAALGSSPVGGDEG